MGIFVVFLCVLAALSDTVLTHPLLYNPYYRYFRYSSPHYYDGPGYANSLNGYLPFYNNHLNPYFAPSLPFPPTFNVLAEQPFAIQNKLSMVPMFLIPQSNINMVSKGHIMGISKNKPIVTIQTQSKNVMQCIPAVRISLDHPLVVYGLTSNVLFPSEVTVLHENLRIPIDIGAVIVPISPNTYVSQQSPLSVNVVYAIPTQPLNVHFINFVSDLSLTKPALSGSNQTHIQKPGTDYVNSNKDVIVDPDSQSIIVESSGVHDDVDDQIITILNFPDREAEPETLNYQPVISEDGDDDLVNRNPPLPVIPAGIVQSTQPEATQELFHNSKESGVLTDLREQSKKNRI